MYGRQRTASIFAGPGIDAGQARRLTWAVSRRAAMTSSIMARRYWVYDHPGLSSSHLAAVQVIGADSTNLVIGADSTNLVIGADSTNLEEPMDGPGHYREAERLIAAARLNTDQFYGEQDAIPTLLAAMAHATLASAAAAALGEAPAEVRAWTEGRHYRARRPRLVR